MRSVIVLDSSPLGLLVQRRDYAQADACRQWLQRHLEQGTRIVVPEIVTYELRRELIRLKKIESINSLAEFNAVEGRYLRLSTESMDLAAELWAKARLAGKPTADVHALDIDVILSAQALTMNIDISDFVVATSNMNHLRQFVPAELWSDV